MHTLGHAAIQGGCASDIIRGGAGNDDFHGGPGDEQLYGGYGNDSLFALFRAGDRLSGGAGGDVFLHGSGNGVDLILDFSRGFDAIEIQGFSADQVRFVSGTDYTVDGFGTWMDDAAIQVSSITDLGFGDLRFARD